ncbi:MAG: Gfo/Idh/MocA family oxidoreductase [Syntrophorhabdaceae bacterium]
MYNIAIIGAGQLGSRHLQGLAKIDIPVTIEVVDPSQDQLNISHARFNDVPRNNNVNGIRFLESIEKINSDIDLCIVATTSDIRSAVTRDLLKNSDVKNIIFEKVLFQSLSDYEDIHNLLAQRNIKAWVNCARRLYPIYKEIKTFFKPGEKIIYRVNGGLWGLACNAIHFIDQVLFLSGGVPYEADISFLDRQILKSKRKGFIELAGTFKMSFDNGSELILDSKQGETGQDVISVLGSHYHVIVVETLGKAIVVHVNDSIDWREINFRNPFQSELTHLVATDILSNGHSELATFSESANEHKLMLEGFMKHIEKVTRQSITKCPIT